MKSGRWLRRSTSGLTATARCCARSMRTKCAARLFCWLWWGSRRSPPSTSCILAATRRVRAWWRRSPGASFPVSRCHCRPKWSRSCANTTARRGDRQRLRAATDYPLHRADRGLNCAATTLPAGSIRCSRQALAAPEMAPRFPIRLLESGSGPAGGGSIAAIDEVGLLKVGRRSPAPQAVTRPSRPLSGFFSAESRLLEFLCSAEKLPCSAEKFLC
jgi:hypothetical protein